MADIVVVFVLPTLCQCQLGNSSDKTLLLTLKVHKHLVCLIQNLEPNLSFLYVVTADLG